MQQGLQKIILLLLASSPWCYGQASAMNGEISGTVADPAGAAISNAAVSVTNRGTGFRQTTMTGDSGLYRFNLLPLGTYDLDVQAPGFAPAKRSGVEVNAGATVTVNLPLQIAGSTTQVEVAATGTPTDPDRTDLGITLDNKATGNLPLVSRNPYNFILLQPNVGGIANTEFGVLLGPARNGAIPAGGGRSRQRQRGSTHWRGRGKDSISRL